jgi:hypothetical protein
LCIEEIKSLTDSKLAGRGANPASLQVLKEEVHQPLQSAILLFKLCTASDDPNWQLAYE